VVSHFCCWVKSRYPKTDGDCATAARLTKARETATAWVRCTR